MYRCPYSVIENCKVLPMFGPGPDINYAKVAGLLAASGLPLAEVLFRAPGADEVVRKLKETLPSLCIGAGTILTPEQVDLAVAAGADFIISPGLNPDVVKYCQDRGIAILPGICTPSDIERGLALGLTHFKFFPAERYGGLATIKAFAEPYGLARFLPTGGITRENMTDYLAHPSVFACGGSWMMPRDLIEKQMYDAIGVRLSDAYDATRTLGQAA
jgi:2-dehydro-3-deoxyphosphogluconate aldolase/(4S)-4-hydroxy-2-oxoglutarate aldolase